MDTESPPAISSPDSPSQTYNSVSRQRFIYKPRRLHFFKENAVKERPIDSTTPSESAMDTETSDVPKEQQSGETGDAGDNYPITLVVGLTLIYCANVIPFYYRESEVGQQPSDTGNVVQV
ncbi:hypothetical protein TELCIR_00543 [Teladorsagia circumcincta]|uniref:Uncharacterized protein n=1 Tax=Teladorsagia circumcincta TaxID=45464 RepID=A0A2G9V4F0_TELCI|nr:hypothetical protein TELCIR_00543 [Teladorsagia circumcincta]